METITARKTKALRASQMRSPKENGTVLLRRTFNQQDFYGNVIRFWRVVGPQTHRNINSDLSIEGLKEWGII